MDEDKEKEKLKEGKKNEGENYRLWKGKKLMKIRQGIKKSKKSCKGKNRGRWMRINTEQSTKNTWAENDKDLRKEKKEQEQGRE